MDSLDDILNFLPLSDRWGTSGQPDRKQFEDIHKAGYTVVINLALPTSIRAIPDEAELVRGLGMDYIAIPVVYENPTPEDLDLFFKTMDSLAGKKVYIHCAVNKRVSSFMYLYRVLRLGMEREEAWLSVLEIWEPDPIWQKFIDRMLPPLEGK